MWNRQQYDAFQIKRVLARMQIYAIFYFYLFFFYVISVCSVKYYENNFYNKNNIILTIDIAISYNGTLTMLIKMQKRTWMAINW